MNNDHETNACLEHLLQVSIERSGGFPGWEDYDGTQYSGTRVFMIWNTDAKFELNPLGSLVVFVSQCFGLNKIDCDLN